MPFQEIDISNIINEELDRDSDFKTAWEDSRMEYELIGEMIKMRKAKGYSQADIANMIGKKQQIISRIENKEASPTLKTLCKIAKKLDCDIVLVPKK